MLVFLGIGDGGEVARREREVGEAEATPSSRDHKRLETVSISDTGI